MTNNLKVLGKDILKCTKYSGIFSGILIIVSGLISLIASRANWISVLESMRATLFVVGSIGLLMGAVSVLLKGRSNKNAVELEEMPEWKSKFARLSFKYAIIVSSFLVIACGCIVDRIIFAII